MTIEKLESGTLVITGDSINLYRLLALKSALQLEVNTGMKLRVNTLAVARSFGFEGRTKRQALTFIEDLWAQIEIERAENTPS